MDIKSKSYSHSKIVKLILFIIIIASFTRGFGKFIDLSLEENQNLDSIFEKDFRESQQYNIERYEILDNLYKLIASYKSQEYIKSGALVTDEDIMYFQDGEYFRKFREKSGFYNWELSDEENVKIFREKFPKEYKLAKERIIERELSEYDKAVEKLNDYTGIYYYATNGKELFTNVEKKNMKKEFFKSQLGYLILDSQGLKTSDDKRDSRQRIGGYDNFSDKNHKIYVGFSEKYFKENVQSWEKSRSIIINKLKKVIISFIILGIAFLSLATMTGRNYFNDNEVHMATIDKLFTDLNFGLFITDIGIWLALIAEFMTYWERVYLFTAIFGTIGLVLLLSLIRHMKNRTIIKHSLIYSIFSNIFKFFKSIFKATGLGKRVIAILFIYSFLALLSFIIFPVNLILLPVLFLAMAYYCLKKVKEFEKIERGIYKIREGDLSHKIDIESTGTFKKLAENINTIALGLNNAVDNELKSERMKTELITNVSHDIRTPLTSIITYIDLLKNEENKDKRDEYIKILEKKSMRLKSLTDDLFEASKVSSGNIPVNFTKIDIVSLITQGLGELDDKVKENKLEFVIDSDREEIFILADGELLWRAIENLFSNIFKYAMKNSRVYIDINCKSGIVYIVMKNVSSHRLNISSKELMERFKRGDESRSTEGSGLGLSIAESLINLQKGEFDIEIDGDLFKSVIKLPFYS